LFDVHFCPRVVQRLQSNRDCAVLAGFLGYLDDRGHRRNTIHQYLRAAELFLRYLRRCRQVIASIDEVAVRSFAFHRRSTPRTGRSTHAALRHLLRYLRETGAANVPSESTKPALERLISEYDSHLDRVSGLAPATRLYRRRYARLFAQFVFGSERMDWRTLRSEQIHDFIAQFGTKGRTAAAQVAAVSLRSFLRWLLFLGRVKACVVASVPNFRRWRLASLQMVLSDGQLKSFLESFDRTHPTGSRDYAMALCMADLGMRVSEVADLRIDQVDAERGVLHLSAGKSRRERLLPMPDRVRQAVTAYICRGRPETTEPYLFVRHRLPIGAAVTRELVRGVMRRGYARVPGCDRLTGTHVLRHTAATRLQRAGADLKQVADILGHRSLDTTAIYTKLDLRQLAEVALSWPVPKEVHS
jgi:integrase/recombinase XerD